MHHEMCVSDSAVHLIFTYLLILQNTLYGSVYKIQIWVYCTIYAGIGLWRDVIGLGSYKGCDWDENDVSSWDDSKRRRTWGRQFLWGKTKWSQLNYNRDWVASEAQHIQDKYTSADIWTHNGVCSVIRLHFVFPNIIIVSTSSYDRFRSETKPEYFHFLIGFLRSHLMDETALVTLLHYRYRHTVIEVVSTVTIQCVGLEWENPEIILSSFK